MREWLAQTVPLVNPGGLPQTIRAAGSGHELHNPEAALFDIARSCQALSTWPNRSRREGRLPSGKFREPFS